MFPLKIVIFHSWWYINWLYHLVGGWALPLWKIMEFVSWDYYSQLNGKKILFQTTNQSWYITISTNNNIVISMMISLLIIVVSCHFTIFPPLLQSNGYKLYPHVSWNYQWIHCFFQEKNAPNCPFVSGVNSTWTKYQHPANEDLKKLTKCSVSQECRTSHVDHARSSPNINGLSSIYRKSWFFAITFCYPANLPLYKKKTVTWFPCPSASFCERKPFATGEDSAARATASCGWCRAIQLY